MFPALMFIVAEQNGIPQLIDNKFYTSEVWARKRLERLKKSNPDFNYFIAYADSFKRLS